MSDKNGYIELRHNGDPFGHGFTGIELQNRDDDYGIYRGDIGAQSREWWRNYCRRNNYVLIEVR